MRDRLDRWALELQRFVPAFASIEHITIALLAACLSAISQKPMSYTFCKDDDRILVEQQLALARDRTKALKLPEWREIAAKADGARNLNGAVVELMLRYSDHDWETS